MRLKGNFKSQIKLVAKGFYNSNIISLTLRDLLLFSKEENWLSLLGGFV
jgi:hypothetical protein